ncbi:hypothetical protein [Microbacterium sp. RG1]|uniref:hypothetical protein n=1 Tax=Microbacterium sp. RG1 TaxID=2489212 RepID=UPI0010CA5460|nr:hypothetical protein [Microbacterium sp. RG1]QCQ15455.1 hypothetical protein EHF32_01180 [Microbacterium sp. RG1]
MTEPFTDPQGRSRSDVVTDKTDGTRWRIRNIRENPDVPGASQYEVQGADIVTIDQWRDAHDFETK